jgi:hypothetical protein
MLRRPTLVTVAIALVVTLTACTESARIPDAEPSSEGAPLFASDEEALAAATAAYQEYLAASGQVSSSADLDISPIVDLVTEAYLVNEAATLDQFESRGLRTAGDSILAGSALQQWFESGSGGVTVIIYACVDVSNVRLIDRDGVDVTPADRPAIAALEVQFISGVAGSEQLLLESSVPWTDTGVCG